MTRADLTPGNTRLRARLADVLRNEQLARIATRDDVVQALRATGTTVPGGVVDDMRLLGVIDDRHDDLLRAAVRAYEPAARGLVLAVVSDIDRADLIALVRGAIADTPPDRMLAAVRAVGRLDPVTVGDLVADEPGAVLARLVARRLPDPDTARAVAHGWRRLELHGDVAEFEATVATAHVTSVERQLDRWGPAAGPVREHLARTRDATNLVTALRLRGHGDARAGELLPPGGIGRRALTTVIGGGDVLAVVPAPWRPGVAAALPHGVEAIARAVEDLVDAQAQRPLERTDPLGAAVPVAYVSAVRAEARALRRAAQPLATAARTAVAA